jgi:predicted nucleic acid-binding protein
MAKVLINSGTKIPSATNRLIMRITKASNIEGFDFEILPTSPDTSYTFDQFWVDVGVNMNLYNPGWGDSIHCVVMNNNGVETIISMDAKDDFEAVPGILLLHPKAILDGMK